MLETNQTSASVSEQDIATLETFAEQNLQAKQLSEVMEAEPTFVQRGGIYFISVVLFVSACLLYFGKVPIWVSAKGKIVPEGESLSVTALQNGVVTKVFASVGDRLPKGAPIITVDRRESSLNIASLKRELEIQKKQMQAMQMDASTIQNILLSPEAFTTAQNLPVNIKDNKNLQLINALKKSGVEMANAKLTSQQSSQEKRQQTLREIALTRDKIALLEKHKQVDINNFNKSQANLLEKKKRLDVSRQLAQAEYNSKLALARQKLTMLENQKQTAIKNLKKDEENFIGKKKRLDETRQLIARGFLSKIELEAEEERYRNAELALEQSRQQIEQKNVEILNERSSSTQITLEVIKSKAEGDEYKNAELALEESRKQLQQKNLDISNEKLRLSEMEIKLQSDKTETSQQYQLAEMNYRQSLTDLQQSLENISTETKKLEAEIKNTNDKLQLAESKINYTTVTMPIKGTLGELKVKNPGEMVSEGTQVAVVLPQGTPLVVNAAVLNKDIGFIKKGLEARVKVEAYPFQQFSTVPARVRQVFPNVGNQESFTVTLELLQDSIKSGKQEIHLFPGLAVQAEVQTGKMRLYELLFSKQEGSENSKKSE